MPPLRDIRDFIPKTAQTDPNKFPAVEYMRYPLMPTGKDGKPLLDDVGRNIIFKGKDEEDAYYEEHPEHAEFRHTDPEDARDELSRLREENARMKAERTNSDDAKTGDDAKDPKKNELSGLVGGKTPAPKPGSKL